MFKQFCLRNFAIVIFIFNISIVYAQDDKIFPVPGGNDNQLFYLQRTPNVNTIVYELNYKNGELDSKEPVHVFWIRYQEKGQRTELNYIQRSFAYGIKSKLLSKDFYELHIVSYKKRLLYLRKGANNKFYVYTIINNEQIMLDRIFLKINGGSLWSPNIEYAELKGIDPATGKEVVERLKI